jgi:hypothetical protein
VSLVDEFARLLHLRGLGTYRSDGTAGGDVYLGVMPNEPEACVAVARYPGPESDGRLGYDEPRIQVRVRAARGDVTVAEDRAQDIYDDLHGLTSTRLPLGTYLVSLLGVQGGPAYIGQDEQGRAEYVVNFRAHLRRQTTQRE